MELEISKGTVTLVVRVNGKEYYKQSEKRKGYWRMEAILESIFRSIWERYKEAEVDVELRHNLRTAKSGLRNFLIGKFKVYSPDNHFTEWTWEPLNKDAETIEELILYDGYREYSLVREEVIW